MVTESAGAGTPASPYILSHYALVHLLMPFGLTGVGMLPFLHARAFAMVAKFHSVVTA